MVILLIRLNLWKHTFAVEQSSEHSIKLLTVSERRGMPFVTLCCSKKMGSVPDSHSDEYAEC